MSNNQLAKYNTSSAFRYINNNLLKLLFSTIQTYVIVDNEQHGHVQVNLNESMMSGISFLEESFPDMDLIGNYIFNFYIGIFF